MLDFLNEQDSMLRVFWYISLATSLIFLVQTVLTFIGSDAHDGTHADFNGDLDHGDAPFQLFSFRNLINFLLGFGWTGVAFYNSIGSKILLIVLAFAVGCGFVMLFFFLIQQIMKLTEDNTFKIESLMGQTGEVYLKIPADFKGRGKVQISHNGTSHELQAMTHFQEDIPSGTTVRVTSIEDKVLIVSHLEDVHLKNTK